jgi:hypothetical protein
MGLTLFTLGGLFAPLQGLVAALLPVHGSARQQRPCGAARAGTGLQRASRPATVTAATTRPCRPLRVVRVVHIVEPARAAAVDAGRLRISGRMADVCAELDRLAALEGTAL